MTQERETPADAAAAVICEVEPWALPEPEPMTLIALWPGDEPPTQLEILAALSSAADQDAQVLEELSLDEPDVPWAIVVGIPGLPVALNIWTEPARELPPDETDAIGAADCKWVVGVETLLEPGDPLDRFITLMRLVTSALESSPAILDVNTTQWHTRHDLDEHFTDSSIDPPVEVLWVIQIVNREGDEQCTGSSWLHTHGLWRCGKPELEMLEVPSAYTNRACELLSTIAGRLLEEPPPAPGEPLMIGNDMAVILQPWQEVAPYLADDMPGSMRDRADENDNAHTGVRAVVCDPNPRGAYRPLWVWPQAVLDRMERDDAVLYPAKRISQRQASIARATWPELATMFTSLSEPLLRTDIDPVRPTDSPSVRFIIKAGFLESDQPEENREHLWFVVRRFVGDSAEAQLVNQPIHFSQLKKGDITHVQRETVSDWSVITPQGSFGPSSVGQMQRVIDELREEVLKT